MSRNQTAYRQRPDTLISSSLPPLPPPILQPLTALPSSSFDDRDIKPENILIESTGELGQGLKLADFGSCRGIYSKQPYTEYISTRWYDTKDTWNESIAEYDVYSIVDHAY